MDDKERSDLKAALSDDSLNGVAGGGARRSSGDDPVCVFCGATGKGVKFAEGHPLAFPTGRVCVSCQKQKGIPLFL